MDLVIKSLLQAIAPALSHKEYWELVEQLSAEQSSDLHSFYHRSGVFLKLPECRELHCCECLMGEAVCPHRQQIDQLTVERLGVLQSMINSLDNIEVLKGVCRTCERVFTVQNNRGSNCKCCVCIDCRKKKYIEEDYNVYCGKCKDFYGVSYVERLLGLAGEVDLERCRAKCENKSCQIVVPVRDLAASCSSGHRLCLSCGLSEGCPLCRT